MSEILIIGFIIGMTHAFQLDHLSAVLSLSVKNFSIYNSLKKGVSWGIGHTITLSIIVIPLFLTKKVVYPSLELILEMFIGFMLIFLGFRLIIEIKKNKVHIHKHRHDDGKIHIHFHSHDLTDGNHLKSIHNHKHNDFITWNTLTVGLLHGFAGSAALLIILRGLIEENWLIFPAVIIFGIGSLFGMAAITLFLSISLTVVSKKTEKIFFLIRYIAAYLALLIGCYLVLDGFIKFI